MLFLCLCHRATQAFFHPSVCLLITKVSGHFLKNYSMQRYHIVVITRDHSEMINLWSGYFCSSYCDAIFTWWNITILWLPSNVPIGPPWACTVLTTKLEFFLSSLAIEESAYVFDDQTTFVKMLKDIWGNLEPLSINSLRPSKTYMHQQTRPSLAQIMAWRQTGDKSVTGYYLYQWWLIIICTFAFKLTWNFHQKYNHSHLRNCIWKCCLQNGDYFFLTPMCSEEAGTYFHQFYGVCNAFSIITSYIQCLDNHETIYWISPHCCSLLMCAVCKSLSIGKENKVFEQLICCV